MQTTVIIHIYNEEYLLPFWLEYNKPIFDNMVIIDYHSTDNSVNICKQICPNAIIITTRNNDFDLTNVAIENAEIENSIPGFKIILNITEFLILDKPLKEILKSYNKEKLCIPIENFTPYTCNQNDNIKDYKDLFRKLLDDDVVYDPELKPGFRFLHNYNVGLYDIGRHTSAIEDKEPLSKDMIMLRLAFYPFNDRFIDRKLQIQHRMSLRDRLRGFGFHYITTKEKQLEYVNEMCKKCIPLNKYNLELYNRISNMVEKFN
jgi:hypothetical protein